MNDMKYLIVLATASLSATKVSLQGIAAKKGSGTIAESIFLTMLVFMAAALLFSPFLFTASSGLWLYAVLYAVCNMSFQISYTCALTRGNVSAAVMFANFGMLVPVAVSCIAFGERPSWLRIVGIILMLFSLLVMTKPDRSGAKFSKGIGYALFAMLANGAGLAVQKFFGKSDVGSENLAFVAASYTLSAIMCTAVYWLCFRKKRPNTGGLGRVYFLAASGTGVSLAAYLALNTYAAKAVDGSFHYPVHSGLSMLLSMLSSVLIFRDTLSKKQILALTVGIAAVVLMNF